MFGLDFQGFQSVLAFSTFATNATAAVLENSHQKLKVALSPAKFWSAICVVVGLRSKNKTSLTVLTGSKTIILNLQLLESLIVHYHVFLIKSSVVGVSFFALESGDRHRHVDSWA